MDSPLSTLIFDITGPFAHYKRIFATTTALSYPIPPKTSLYGLFGAIIGLDKEDNDYLNSFKEGECRIALELLQPVRTQRISMNLRPAFGSLSANENRKPTLMEFIERPLYRIYFTHRNQDIYQRLRTMLQAGQSHYTPTLGLANLIAGVTYIGEGSATLLDSAEYVDISSVIPKTRLNQLGHLIPESSDRVNRLMEVSQYAVEMTPQRDVTVRDDVIIDRNGRSINAKVQDAHTVTWKNEARRVIFF